VLGNLNLLLGSVALAVVLTALFVPAAMAMSVLSDDQIAVMRTLGFPARIFCWSWRGWSRSSAASSRRLSRLLINGEARPDRRFIPAFASPTERRGRPRPKRADRRAAVIPATMASRLKIVDVAACGMHENAKNAETILRDFCAIV
jgi:hypothetical protein